jgi:hypothetical protein
LNASSHHRRWWAARIAAAERRTSSVVVLQLQTEIRIIARPCHTVPESQQVPSL